LPFKLLPKDSNAKEGGIIESESLSVELNTYKQSTLKRMGWGEDNKKPSCPIGHL
jgi:hypothetical protein